MKIIIAGCGKVGMTLVESLTAEGHDITIIDPLKKAIDAAKIYDILSVQGNAADPGALEEADAENADLIVATTNSDEVNMLCCFFAKSLGCKQTIARVRGTDYDDRDLDFMKNKLGLSMTINPELLAARELFNILKLPSALKIETFSSRRFEMIELRLKQGSLLAGMKLSELRENFKEKFLICAVQRADKVFIPDGNFVLNEGDKIGITAEPAVITKLLKNLKILQKQARKVMIVGGSRTSFYLAKRLAAGGNTVKILEKEPERCHDLEVLLKDVEILHGDAANQEVLEEEGILDMDAFVALTGMDEENILLSYYAESRGVGKVIAKVNRAELVHIAEQMGLESIVSPKKLVSDVIISYVRALKNSVGSKVETLYKLMDSNVEALEFIATRDFRGSDVQLKDIVLKNNILIAGIVRGRETIIPTGSDVILPGDRVVVISADRKLSDLGDILK